MVTTWLIYTCSPRQGSCVLLPKHSARPDFLYEFPAPICDLAEKQHRNGSTVHRVSDKEPQWEQKAKLTTQSIFVAQFGAVWMREGMLPRSPQVQWSCWECPQLSQDILFSPSYQFNTCFTSNHQIKDFSMQGRWWKKGTAHQTSWDCRFSHQTFVTSCFKAAYRYQKQIISQSLNLVFPGLT